MLAGLCLIVVQWLDSFVRFSRWRIYYSNPFYCCLLKPVGYPQEALFEAPFCNPFYFVFAVLGGWGGFWVLGGGG